MKLLVVCSSLDLRHPYSSTPAWWQLLKNLCESGVDLIATPYQGYAIESPWWRAYDNPCQLEGDLFARARPLTRRLRHRPEGERPAEGGESVSDKVLRSLVQTFVRPRWQRHLSTILETDQGIDAILTLNVPPNHFKGLPTYLQRRYGVPTIHYDGDVPASLPRFQGFASGFRHYQGADLKEYQGLISSSRGGAEELLQLGAGEVKVLYYGVDPRWFGEMSLEQDIDVFFYGHGYEYRWDWIEAMIVEPSRRMTDTRFAIRATDVDNDLGNTERLPYSSLGKLREYSSRSKLNLNITRAPHASVYASSTARLFELGAMGCCTVSNPCEGMEEWFEVGKEIVVLEESAQAVDTYRRLLADVELRREIGRRARARVLREHTYEHRARELLGILKGFLSR